MIRFFKNHTTKSFDFDLEILDSKSSDSFFLKSNDSIFLKSHVQIIWFWFENFRIKIKVFLVNSYSR